MAKKEKAAPAKYTDKSAGQPHLVSIFRTLRELLLKYAKRNYRAKADAPGHYELYYDKDVYVYDRDFPELPFCSLLIQKGYVGLYFTPVYVIPGLKAKMSARLLASLKGKTCFHIRSLDDELLKEIREIVDLGYKGYVSQSWK